MAEIWAKKANKCGSAEFASDDGMVVVTCDERDGR